MKIWSLVIKEIAFRKLDFLLGVLAVCAAVGCLVATLTLVEGHTVQAESLAVIHEESTLSLMRTVEDDYRKITKDMGYNVLLLSAEQDMAAYLDQGYATEHMPESFVDDLAASKVMTIRHLMPTLQHRLEWPEQDNTPIILLGTRSEYTLNYRPPSKPVIDSVSPGKVRIGHVLHEKLGINEGDTVTVLGKSFEVIKVHGPKGNEDDISVWMHLSEAQALLNMPDTINAIMALSCHCADSSLGKIQNEINKILPETQVLQLAAQTQARADTRDRAASLSLEATEDQSAYHHDLRQRREAMAAWLVPVVILGAICWVGFLMLGNVRARRDEIGILRALGFGAWNLVQVFFARALLMGLIGAGIGMVLGVVIATSWGKAEGLLFSDAVWSLVQPQWVLTIFIATPVLACVATWIPALIAAQQDPADVLGRDA